MKQKLPILEYSEEQVRAWAGLPLNISDVQFRKCLGCGELKEFEGKFHRICKFCKARQENGTDLEGFVKGES